MSISIRTKQVVAVTKDLKEELYSRLQRQDEISTEEARAILATVFGEVSTKMKRARSTIADKCTRKLGILTDEFFELVKDYITGVNSELVDLAVKTKNGRDSEDGIREAFKDI